jgi:hypothetical protein
MDPVGTSSRPTSGPRALSFEETGSPVESLKSIYLQCKKQKDVSGDKDSAGRLQTCRPYAVHNRVLMIVERWGPVSPIPQFFEDKILQGRYDRTIIMGGGGSHEKVRRISSLIIIAVLFRMIRSP